MVARVISPNINPYGAVRGGMRCSENSKMIEYPYGTLTKEQCCSSGSSCSQQEEFKMSKKAQRPSSSNKGQPFQRGGTNSPWTFVVYVPDPCTGKLKQKWHSGYPTEKEASKAREIILAQIKLGQYQAKCNKTVASYINSWFEEIHKPTLKPTTARGYEVNIRKHIIPCLGNIHLDKLTRRDIMLLHNTMKSEGSSAKTIRYAHRVLSMCLKEAVLDNQISKNPCDGVKLPKDTKYNAATLNSEQVQCLLVGAKQSPIELELLLAVTLGLRRGEVLGLRFSDFDFTKGIVHIQRQITVVKSSKEPPLGSTEWGLTGLKTQESDRVLFVPSTTLAAVRERQKQYKINRLKYGKEYQDSDFVCCNERGHFINPHTLQTQHKKLLKQLGLPIIRFHDLRHTYATTMIEQKVPLPTVSHMLGHSTITTTADIYCKVINSDKGAAITAEQCFFSKDAD